MNRYRRLFRLTIAFLLLSVFEAPAWAGGGGWGLFAAALGLTVVANAPFAWYAPYDPEPYYPDYPAYSYGPPPYAYANPPVRAEVPVYPEPVVRHVYLGPFLPNMTPAPGTPLPANEVPRVDPAKVTEKLAVVRAMLDHKAATGDITNAQRDSETAYIAQIERVARAQAAAQNGLLSSKQEEALLHEIAHVDTLITQNFIPL